MNEKKAEKRLKHRIYLRKLRIGSAIESLEKRLRVYKINDSNVLFYSKSILEKSMIDGLMRGRLIDDMIDYIIYFAIRITAYPMTLYEIQRIRGKNLQIKTIKTIDDVIKKLGYEYQEFPFYKYIESKIEKLDIPDPMKRAFNGLLSILNEGNFDIERKDAIPKIASAIYMLSERCGVDLTQKAIAKEFGLSENTIREHYRKFERIIEKVEGIDSVRDEIRAKNVG